MSTLRVAAGISGYSFVANGKNRTDHRRVGGAGAGAGAAVRARTGTIWSLVARRRDQLEALATRLAAEHGVVARIISADLADPGAPQRIFDELGASVGLEIEFLVNNAGFGTSGPFVERDLCASWRWSRSTSPR